MISITLRPIILAAALVATPALAQHTGHSPYSGQQQRAIKALSDKEVKDLLDGAGMGFAKAAELNSYPGPMHALEHAAALELSPAQREDLGALMKRHKAEARALGARVVELERELDALFATKAASLASLDRVLGLLGEASARLRGSHLRTHVETTAMLTPSQVDRYVAVRGYADASAGGKDATHRH